MNVNRNKLTPLIQSGAGIGYASNACVRRYLIEAESTTGFVAFKIADGTTLVSEAAQVFIKASQFLTFWPCAGYTDTTPAGRITSFDCHGNSLSALDVRGLTGLEYLDCSFNGLSQLPLDGLTGLQGIDADNNQLKNLDVRSLTGLRVLYCASNQLRELDLSGLGRLEILDCSDNPLTSPKLDGCTARQDINSSGESGSFPIAKS